MRRCILVHIHLTGAQIRLCQVHYVASASHPHTKVSIIQPIPGKSKFVATFMLSSEIFQGVHNYKTRFNGAS